jgi:hypothetical protein
METKTSNESDNSKKNYYTAKIELHHNQIDKGKYAPQERAYEWHPTPLEAYIDPGKNQNHQKSNVFSNLL